MPQICKICNHPQREEINADIIEGRMSMRAIANKYPDISYSGVRWHKEHHLKDVIKKIKDKRDAVTEGQVLSTLDALDKVIEQLPQVLETASLNTVLRALELRAKIRGEEAQPPRIIIEWGLPFDKEYFKQITSGGRQYQKLPDLGGQPIDADYDELPPDPISSDQEG